METVAWHGCYDGSWKGVCSDASFSHPAKFSRNLIERIVEHGIERGYWRVGDLVADPFGGVGLGGIVCAYRGIRWVGVELEPRFVEMATTGYECDGTVEWGEVEIPAAKSVPGWPGGWLVRLRVEAAYWGSDGARRDGDWQGATPFESQEAAERFIDTLVAASDRWPRDSYAAVDMEPEEAESAQPARTERKCLRKSKCGKEEAHEPHHCPGNFEIHRAAWKKLGLPVPVLVQGDSRDFARIVGQVGGAVTSPPFVDSMSDKPSTSVLAGSGGRMGASCKGDNYGETPGQIGRLSAGTLDAAISSPPYAESEVASACKSQNPDGRQQSYKRAMGCNNYGTTPGNIGNLREGELAAVVTSPPYAETPVSSDGQRGIGSGMELSQMAEKRKADRKRTPDGYSQTAGQIGNLSGGSVDSVIDAAVTSPPWEKCLESGGGINIDKLYDGMVEKWGRSGSEADRKKQVELMSRRVQGRSYGADDEAQIGNTQKEDYWTAMKTVYGQVRQALKPGGVLAVVLKGYIKRGKYVDLPADTLTLLVSLGFEPLERIHAMLVKETTENTLFDGPVTKRKEKKSFFRKLAEAKGAPRIDFEVVLFVRKP